MSFEDFKAQLGVWPLKPQCYDLGDKVYTAHYVRAWDRPTVVYSRGGILFSFEGECPFPVESLKGAVDLVHYHHCMNSDD